MQFFFDSHSHPCSPVQDEVWAAAPLLAVPEACGALGQLTALLPGLTETEPTGRAAAAAAAALLLLAVITRLESEEGGGPPGLLIPKHRTASKSTVGPCRV